MTVIPNFILRRMYKNGSLRRLPEGVAFDIVNALGPGQISQLNSVSLNGQVYSSNQIVLVMNDVRIPGESISEENPATFFLNQVITCLLKDADAAPGKYELVLDLISKEAGKVTLTVQDTLPA